MNTKTVERRTGDCSPSTAKRKAIEGKPTSAPILPKVSGWTPARRNYRAARLALAASLRWLPAYEKPFSAKHRHIYHEFACAMDYPYSFINRVWEAAREDEHNYLYSYVLGRWVNIYELRPGERLGQ